VSGTEWTGPGQGSTVRQLIGAFGRKAAIPTRGIFGKNLGYAANLRLTGSPITEEDWARLESEQFQVGGQS